jgi:lipid-binding SYLF domain-containing protein
MVHTEKLYATECMRFDIGQALDILDEAKHLPSHYYANCYGVLILCAKEVGTLVTGIAGSGLLLSHDPLTNVWSSPLSVKLLGIGLGLSMGSDAKDMIVFFQSRSIISKFAANYHLHLEGRAANHWGQKESKEQHHQTTTFCFSNGVYYGVELEGVVIKSNMKRHRDFYGAAITPRQILLGSNKVRCNRRSRVKSLHDELMLLAGQGQRVVNEDEVKNELPSWISSLTATGVQAI